MSRLKKPVKSKNRRRPMTDGPVIGASCHLFSGGPDESAVRFLGAFNSDAARYDWTDAQRLGAFEDALVCEPRRWFRRGGFRNWKSLEKAFLLRWAFTGAASDAVDWSDTGESSDESAIDGGTIRPVTANAEDVVTGSGDVTSDGTVTSDDGMISMSDLFDRVRPNRTFVSRRHEHAVPQTRGISNLKDFISTLD